MTNELPPGISEHSLADVNVKTGTSKKVKFYCGYNCTDMGNANRLISLFGDKMRYCAELKTWFIYDGVRWARDTTKLIEDLAKQTAILIHAEVAKVDVKDKDGRGKLTKWAFESESQKRIKAMVQNAESDRRIAIMPQEFNANKMLINCPNGTLDLEWREFREHRREDMLTMLTGAPYPRPDHESKLFFSNRKSRVAAR